MNKLKVAIIHGGPSSEREVSLISGLQVFKNLSHDQYEISLIDINKKGEWLITDSDIKENINKKLNIFPYEEGFEASDLKNFDVIFNALHGSFGEDGQVQAILDILKIPYTGSGLMASALAINKAKTLNFLKNFDIKIANSLVLNKNYDNNIEDINEKIEEKIKYPCIVKPSTSGSSVGVTKIENKKELSKAIENAFLENKVILIEEFINGRELTCGIIGNSNGREIIALPPVEIKTNNFFYDYESKYISDKTEYLCPAPLLDDLNNKIKNLSIKAHQLLECDGVSRSDFILKDDQFYYLETNTSPGLTEHSLCPKEAKSYGMSFSEFLNKQIELALEK